MSSSVSVRSLYDKASLGFCAPSLVSAMALPRPEPTIVQKVRIIELRCQHSRPVVEMRAPFAQRRRRPVWQRSDPSRSCFCLDSSCPLVLSKGSGEKETKGHAGWTTPSASGPTPCPSLHHPSFAHGGSSSDHTVWIHLVSRAKSRHTPISFRLSKHARSRRCAGRSSSSSVACI